MTELEAHSTNPTEAINRGTMLDVPLPRLEPDDAALRKNVNKKDPRWKELVSSIRKSGIHTPLLVRRNPEDKDSYIIIGGLHRFTAAQEILETENQRRETTGEPQIDPYEYTLPCNVVPCDSAMDVYRLQLSDNIQDIDTKPIQICEHLLCMIADAKENGYELTQADLAREIDRSQTYVSKILKLKKLKPDIQEAVNEGKITAANAFNLAKLPEEEQSHYLDRAMTMDSEDFAEQVAAYVSELKKQKSGQRANKDEFVVQPKLLTKADAIALLDNWYQDYVEPRGGEAFINEVSEQLQSEDVEDLPGPFIIGVYYGLQRMLQLDSETVEKKRAEHEAQVQERERKKAEKDAERESKTAAQRGVSVLQPKSASRPKGFSEENVA